MPHPHPLRRVALPVAVAASLPYVVLKLMWLGGSTIGVTSSAGAREMEDTRFVTGNVVTVLLVVTALAFLVAVSRPGARRVPAWLVLVLGAGATGLLGPILLGLPVGLVVQLVAEGRVGPDEETGLAPWVFGVVYSGFGLLAVAMAVVVAAYVVDRWGHLLAEPPPAPSRPVALAGAAGLLPFSAAMLWWAARGPGDTGPAGMESPAQRTVLLVTGVLALAAFAVPLLGERARGWPRTAWLVTWTGCCTTALQAPALMLLAQGGDIQPGVALSALVATPGACVYGLAALHRRLSASAGGRAEPHRRAPTRVCAGRA